MKIAFAFSATSKSLGIPPSPQDLDKHNSVSSATRAPTIFGFAPKNRRRTISKHLNNLIGQDWLKLALTSSNPEPMPVAAYRWIGGRGG